MSAIVLLLQRRFRWLLYSSFYGKILVTRNVFPIFYVGKESLQKLKTNKQLELQTVVMQFVRYQPMLLETVLYFWSSRNLLKNVKIVPLDSHVPLDSCLFFHGLVSVDLFGLTYTPQKGIFPLFSYSYLEFW